MQNDQEIKEEPDQGEQGTKVEKREGERERKNRWDDNRPVEAKKRQRSPSEKRKWSPPPRKPDDEPDYDENAVLLSWCKWNCISCVIIGHSLTFKCSVGCATKHHKNENFGLFE